MAYLCSVCDKEFAHAGGKNLHERWCRLLQLEKEHGTPKKQEDQRTQMKNKKCDHTWILLGNSQAEQLAKENGYTKYCSECEEVE